LQAILKEKAKGYRKNLTVHQELEQNETAAEIKS
jgi:hypothetical protein